MEFQAVGPEMEKVRSASLVSVLAKEYMRVLLVAERRQWDKY